MTLEIVAEQVFARYLTGFTVPGSGELSLKILPTGIAAVIVPRDKLGAAPGKAIYKYEAETKSGVARVIDANRRTLRDAVLWIAERVTRSEEEGTGGWK